MPYQLLPEEKKDQPGLGQQALRVASQIPKEAASIVAGLPGDVGNLLNTFIATPLYKAVTGKEGVPYEQTLLGKALPTSETHRKGIEKKLPYLQPKNKVEKFVADLSADTTSLLLPAFGKAPFKNTLTRAFSTSLGANVLGETIKDLTGDEKKGEYAKLGSLFTLSMLNKPGAVKAARDLYSQASKTLPADAKVSAAPLGRSLDKLKSKILSGRKIQDLAPSEKFVVDQADKVLRNIEGGQINVNTAIAAKRSLSEELQGLFNVVPGKEGTKRARVLASEINHSLKNTLKDYGKQNPEWYKSFSAADQAFGTIAQSNYIEKYIGRHIVHHPVTHGLLHIFGVGVGSATGLAAPYQATKLMHRIYKSPALRKHYLKVMSAAANEDAMIMNREISKLDRELQKEESKSKKLYKFVD